MCAGAASLNAAGHQHNSPSDHQPPKWQPYMWRKKGRKQKLQPHAVTVPHTECGMRRGVARGSAWRRCSLHPSSAMDA